MKNKKVKQKVFGFFLILNFFGLIFSSFAKDELIESLQTFGKTLETFITDVHILYGIYLFSFFFAIFAIFNQLLQSGKKNPFKGKPAKVISAMISIIVVGSIFYGPIIGEDDKSSARSVEDVLELFNNFAGFIIVLLLSIGAFFYGVSLFNKTKDKNKNLAMFFLCLLFYIASSLLMPQLHDGEAKIITVTDSSGKQINSTIENPAGFFYKTFTTLAKSLSVLNSIINSLSFVGIFGYGIVLFFSLFNLDSEKEISTFENKKESQKSKDERKKEKEIKQINNLLNQLSKELKSTNDHFNNKVNILNKIRENISQMVNYGGKN